MQIQFYIDALQEALLASSWLEKLAVIFGVTQVWLSKNNKVSNYLFGIASILLSISVLLHAKLYAEVLLNSYYLVMSVYGYWFWLSGKAVKQQPIRYADRKSWYTVGAIIVLGFLLLYYFLTQFTDSDVAILDALVACTAWAGMWLLARRQIENWILLNISNFMAIPLLIHKDLYLFALLTFILFIIAIFGYLNWQKLIKNQHDAYERTNSTN